MTDTYDELLRRTMRLQLTIKVWGRIVAGHLSKGVRAVAFLSITIIALAGGCNHPRSTPESATPASKGVTQPANEVSQAFIGKQITIRGKLLLGKMGPYILLDNQQEVVLEPDMSSGSFTWEKPYSEMHGKLVEATGTLRFHRRPEDAPLTDKKGQIIDRGSDYFYFELKTAQVRLISH